MFAGDAVFSGDIHWGTRCPMIAGDAVFPDDIHWGIRCPMFAGDAAFPGEVHWGTRCSMFAGDAVFPSEVHWDTRCPIFAGDPDAITYKLSYQLVCCVLCILKSLNFKDLSICIYSNLYYTSLQIWYTTLKFKVVYTTLKFKVVYHICSEVYHCTKCTIKC